jgi:segregation and condensation protein B
MSSPDEQLWEVDAPMELVPDDEAEVLAPPVDVPPAPKPTPLGKKSTEPDDAPPSLSNLVASLLFVGGEPLTATAATATIRGLTATGFEEQIELLNRTYRAQNRPYTIVPRGEGYVLQVKVQFHSLRERLYGGPREVRLSQPALDVLSVIAYKQPVSKGELDAARGQESSGLIRQLLRLGLISATRVATAGRSTVGYCTTPRFLELFQLGSLDDLPRLDDGTGVEA